MLSHTIVFVVLSILWSTAAYAAGMPVARSYQEQPEAGTNDKETIEKESTDAL